MRYSNWIVSDCEELVGDENSTASREYFAHLSGYKRKILK